MFAKLALDSSEYDAGIDKSKEKASSFGDKVKTAFKVGGAAIAAVTTATAALTAQMVKGAGEVAAYGDNIDKMSQKMGLSATAYQEWDAVMQHSGTSIESLQAGMKTLANAVESGNKAFSRLGITEEDIASMNNEELFSATITALQNVENETERTYLAGQLLGRGATELGALLNTSAEDTQAMKDRVHELGGVMSDEAVKASARYQDSLQDMQTAIGGVKRGIVGDFLPSITDVMDGLTELFSGGDGMEKISQGIDGIVQGIGDAAPRILEVGSQIVLALGNAVTANLPSLLDAGVQAVLTIGTGLVEQLPTIVDAGLDVILSLANGIAESLPTLIPTIVDVVLQIVDTLTQPDTLSALIDASIAIILALAAGLIDAFPRLLEKLPELVENIATTLVENAPKVLSAAWELVKTLAKGIIDTLPKIKEAAKKLIKVFVNYIRGQFQNLKDLGKKIIGKVKDGVTKAVEGAKQWGKDLVDNFISGIKQKWEDLKSTVSNVAQTVKDFLGFSEPKMGPLSNFHTYAPDMMRLFAEGIRDNENLIADQIKKSFNFETQTIDFASSASGKSSAATVNAISSAINRNATHGSDLTINLMLSDGTVIARALLDDFINVAAANGTPIATPVRV